MNTPLPSALASSLGSEIQDFAVKAKRAKPVKTSLQLVFMGVFWLAVTSIILLAFFGPILQGEEVHFTSNGVPTVAGPGNLGPLMFPGIFLGFFLVIGLGILGFGIHSFFKKGGYFVGTPTRLISYQGDNLKSTDWEQFTGNIEVKGNAQNGTVALEMRTGKMVRNKRGGFKIRTKFGQFQSASENYVPDQIYLSGIPNAFEIEALCRKRIKENDPTPAVADTMAAQQI